MTATQRPPNIDEETRAFREWHAAVSRPPPGRFIFAGATMLSFDRTGKRRSALAWGETDAEMPWTRRRLEAGDGLGGASRAPRRPPRYVRQCRGGGGPEAWRARLWRAARGGRRARRVERGTGRAARGGPGCCGPTDVGGCVQSAAALADAYAYELHGADAQMPSARWPRRVTAPAPTRRAGDAATKWRRPEVGRARSAN